MPLTIRLKRVSPDHHEFSYTRDDGTGEAARLETRTMLFHDLLHYAVETEAALTRSFYGKLASGCSFAQLKAVASEMQSGEAGLTERVVGSLTGAIQAQAPAQAVVDRFRSFSEALGDEAPDWFDAGFVERVRERMRRLQGEWKAQPFGAEMILTFEA